MAKHWMSEEYMEVENRYIDQANQLRTDQLRTDQLRTNSHQWRSWHRSEDGSLTIFILSLFFITMLLSFAIIDISGVFLAKRELVNIGEVAISRAAHHIDLDRYYSGDRTQVVSSANGPIYLVPIDCQAAASSMQSELSSTTLRGHEISIAQFSCTGDILRATLSSQVEPTLHLPFLGLNTANTLFGIRATLSASNPIGQE
jgi:hypothetical protein